MLICKRKFWFITKFNIRNLHCGNSIWCKKCFKWSIFLVYSYTVQLRKQGLIVLQTFYCFFSLLWSLPTVCWLPPILWLLIFEVQGTEMFQPLLSCPTTALPPHYHLLYHCKPILSYCIQTEETLKNMRN